MIKHSPEDNWVWYTEDERYADWDRWARDILPRAVDEGRRGERHHQVTAPNGETLFVKQYHHGGLLAEPGDVYYNNPEELLVELKRSDKAHRDGLPVPKPVGLLTHHEDPGVLGWYVAEFVPGESFSSVLRDPDRAGPRATEAGRLLARLHEAGLDHRDYQIKNLRVREDQLLVIDFIPCDNVNPGPMKRARRLLRFRRSLDKYGFDSKLWTKFLSGYREISGSDHGISRGIQLPAYAIKHWLGDLIYATRGRPLESVDTEKILVRVPNWLGETVMSLPALQSLRSQYPEARIDVIGRNKILPIYQQSPAVDRTHGLEGKSWKWPPEIADQAYASAVILPKSFRTGFQAWISGIPRRIGFGTQGRGWMLTNPVEFNREQTDLHHARLYHRAFGPLLKIPEQLPDPELSIPESAKQSVRNHVEPPYICFHPGAAYGPAKRWPPERFARALENILDEFSGSIVAIGVTKEKPISAQIKSYLDTDRLVDLVGETSLVKCMAILANSEALVANDSGIMHLASGLGVPTLGIFGSTDPNLTAPLGTDSVVAYEGVSCSPCFERECPLDENQYRCLTRIQPDAVSKQLLEIMNSPEEPHINAPQFNKFQP